MKSLPSVFTTICIVLALAVALGAFGAHALDERLSDMQIETWQTASRYHFYHGLGALLLAIVARQQPSRYFAMAIRLHLTGILLFCGSLYLLATQDLFNADLSWLGPVTPLGGAAFIAGWLVAVWGFKAKK